MIINQWLKDITLFTKNPYFDCLVYNFVLSDVFKSFLKPSTKERNDERRPCPN